MAQQLVIASEAENQPTQTHQHEDVVRYFRKLGIHPDQAPDIFAPAAKANAFLAKTAKAQRELMDFQEEVGIEVSSDPYNESYATNKQYDAIQAQIDFLSGDRSKIKRSTETHLGSGCRGVHQQQVQTGEQPTKL